MRATMKARIDRAQQWLISASAPTLKSEQPVNGPVNGPVRPPLKSKGIQVAHICLGVRLIRGMA